MQIALANRIPMPRVRNIADDVVLNRAMSVFWRHGYAATSLRDLTRATGLSTAALYHRFIDKDGLFVEVLRHYADQGPSARVAGLSALSSPLDAIRGFFDELVAISAEDPQQRGCLLVNTALDGAAISAAARELVRARLGEVKTFFGAQLRRGIASGAIDAVIDIDTTADALLGTVLAIRVLARLDPDPDRLRLLADHSLAQLPPAADRIVS
jgi:TetR/AcrR family transcriptional repressor of nem operon